MKRRLLPLALVIASSIVYACSDSSDDPPANPATTPEGGSGSETSTPNPDAATNPDTSTGDSSIPATGNPIEGVGAPVAIPALENVYTEGPQWVADGLYFSEAKPDGHLVKLTLPNTTAEVRSVLTAGHTPLGSTLNEKTGKLLTVEVGNTIAGGGQIVETAVTGAFPRAGTALSLVSDAGVVAFDSPNDLVVRKSDGTIYITDPSYQAGAAGATILTNHIWRVKATTNQVFETKIDGRPNGIALSPDDSILYVSFTDPAGTPAPPPPVMKYPVAADGSLGAPTKFVDIPPGGGQNQDVNSLADGIAVDASGNVYVAVKTGVDVFKADATKWGHITTTKVINGLAFGGADKKTLFMTSGTGLLTVNVKIAGLAQ